MAGFGWCNPAYSNQEPMSNQEYIDTIPDDDPWKPIIQRGAERLDAEFPGWKVEQIKLKFNECRFYASPPEAQWTVEFQNLLSAIEQECDAA